ARRRPQLGMRDADLGRLTNRPSRTRPSPPVTRNALTARPAPGAPVVGVDVLRASTPPTTGVKLFVVVHAGTIGVAQLPCGSTAVFTNENVPLTEVAAAPGLWITAV